MPRVRGPPQFETAGGPPATQTPERSESKWLHRSRKSASDAATPSNKRLQRKPGVRHQSLGSTRESREPPRSPAAKRWTPRLPRVCLSAVESGLAVRSQPRSAHSRASFGHRGDRTEAQLGEDARPPHGASCLSTPVPVAEAVAIGTL